MDTKTKWSIWSCQATAKAWKTTIWTTSQVVRTTLRHSREWLLIFKTTWSTTRLFFHPPLWIQLNWLSAKSCSLRIITGEFNYSCRRMNYLWPGPCLVSLRLSLMTKRRKKSSLTKWRLVISFSKTRINPIESAKSWKLSWLESNSPLRFKFSLQATSNYSLLKLYKRLEQCSPILTRIK
jgi:hypothetical protein